MNRIIKRLVALLFITSIMTSIVGCNSKKGEVYYGGSKSTVPGGTLSFEVKQDSSGWSFTHSYDGDNQLSIDLALRNKEGMYLFLYTIDDDNKTYYSYSQIFVETPFIYDDVEYKGKFIDDSTDNSKILINNWIEELEKDAYQNMDFFEIAQEKLEEILK